MRLAFYINTAAQAHHFYPLILEALAREYEVEYWCHYFAIGNAITPEIIDNTIKSIQETTKDTVKCKRIISKGHLKVCFEKFKPDCVIFADTGIEKMLKLQGMKTAQIFHGITEKNPKGRLFYEPMKDEVSDFIFVPGEYAYNQILHNASEKKDKLHIVGYVKFDTLNLDITRDSRYTILYAPTWDEGHSSLAFIGQYIPLLLDVPNTRVIIKLHDLTRSYMPKWEKYFRASPVEYRTENILDLILQSDVVISDSSSCVFEALALGKPVIAFTNPSMHLVPNSLNADWRELTYEVKSFYELKKLLVTNLQIKPRTGELMDKIFYREKGIKDRLLSLKGASKRILDILEKQL